MTDVARPRRSGLLAIALLVAVAGASWFALSRIGTLERRIDDLSAQVSHLDATIGEATATLKLIRLEADSKGKGIDAILDQLRAWSPELAKASTPDPRARWIENRLGEALDAIAAIGPSAYDPIVAALTAESKRKSPDDELRKWLLRAAARADEARGEQLYVDVLRGTRLQPSPRLRFLAYDDLAKLDKPLAADTLAQILQVESAQGITRQVPPELAKDYERVIGTNQFPQFFNFIGRFARSGHPDVENILLMLLGRHEHDRMTYQECIKELGDLHSKAALKRIEELYDDPPGREYQPDLPDHVPAGDRRDPRRGRVRVVPGEAPQGDRPDRGPEAPRPREVVLPVSGERFATVAAQTAADARTRLRGRRIADAVPVDQ